MMDNKLCTCFHNHFENNFLTIDGREMAFSSSEKRTISLQLQKLFYFPLKVFSSQFVSCFVSVDGSKRSRIWTLYRVSIVQNLEKQPLYYTSSNIIKCEYLPSLVPDSHFQPSNDLLVFTGVNNFLCLWSSVVFLIEKWTSDTIPQIQFLFLI